MHGSEEVSCALHGSEIYTSISLKLSFHVWKTHHLSSQKQQFKAYESCRQATMAFPLEPNNIHNVEMTYASKAVIKCKPFPTEVLARSLISKKAYWIAPWEGKREWTRRFRGSPVKFCGKKGQARPSIGSRTQTFKNTMLFQTVNAVVCSLTLSIDRFQLPTEGSIALTKSR